MSAILDYGIVGLVVAAAAAFIILRTLRTFGRRKSASCSDGEEDGSSFVSPCSGCSGCGRGKR